MSYDLCSLPLLKLKSSDVGVELVRNESLEMKLLLTSQGLTNQTLIDSCLELLGKPFEKARVCFVLTACNPIPGDKSWVVEELDNWQTLGVEGLEVIDFATQDKEFWLPRMQNCDLIFVNGGNTTYLMEQINESGFAEEVSSLLESIVYVGSSAGSYVACPDIRFNTDNVDYVLDGLGLVDFGLQVHMNSPKFPMVANRELVEARIAEQAAPYRVYILDDHTAVKFVEGRVEVVGEGEWLLL